VHTFISVNGVNAGVGAVPYCRPTQLASQVGFFSMCDVLMEQASHRAYTEYAQEHIFQANYWRDPRPVERQAYKEYAQLAQWNNENDHVNQTLKENYAKTQKFVWILAEQDTMVWPKEGEHWGAPDPNDPFHKILPMNETEWYQKDLFGLRTADEAGKNHFESFDGDHLQFSMSDFEGWVTKYLSL
jgi:palmitoyl-protein thioesterase